MRIFKGDVFRFFMIGFAMGALGLAIAMGGDAEDETGLVSRAVAASLTR